MLVDSHTVIWALDNPAKLSIVAIETLENAGNQLTVSAGTICLVEGIPLVSADAVFDQYGVRRIWK